MASVNVFGILGSILDPFGTLSPLLPPDLSPKHHWPLCHFNHHSKTVAEVAVAPAATSSRKYDVHDHNMSQFVDLDDLDDVCVIAGIVQSSRWRPVSWLLEGCFFLTAWFLEYAGWHSWAMPLQMNLHWNVQQRNLWSSWGNSSLTVADVNNGDRNLQLSYLHNTGLFAAKVATMARIFLLESKEVQLQSELSSMLTWWSFKFSFFGMMVAGFSSVLQNLGTQAWSTWGMKC